MNDIKLRQVSVSTEPCAIENLLDYMEELEFAGADLLHCEVWDGSVNGKVTYDWTLLKSIKKSTTLPLDVHLIARNNFKNLRKYCRSKPKLLTVQYDLFFYERQLRKALRIIRRRHILAGLAISYNIPVSYILPFFNLCDAVLIMGVDIENDAPTLIKETFAKIDYLVDLKKRFRKDLTIIYEGEVTDEISDMLYNKGVDILVADKFVFNNKSKRYAINQLKEYKDIMKQKVLPAKKERKRVIKINY